MLDWLACTIPVDLLCKPGANTINGPKHTKFRAILRIIARIAAAIARLAHALASTPTKGNIKPRRKP